MLICDICGSLHRTCDRQNLVADAMAVRLYSKPCRRVQKTPGTKSCTKAPSPKRMVPMREEKAVWKAVDELMSLGPKAFPALIDHFEDERYSYTEDNTTGERIAGPSVNRTVGYLCFHIVTAQVQKYVSWDEPDPRDSPGYNSTVVPWVKKDAVEWIKGRVDKPLWELQIENLSFVIEQNEKLLKDFEKDSHEEKLCKEAIKKNAELIAQLKRTQKPLPSRNPRPRFER